MFQKLVILLAAASSVAVAAPAAVQQHGPEDIPLCAPDLVCTGANNADPNNVCGDFRLGPVHLPDPDVFNITAGYTPFADLCPSAFLVSWYSTAGPRPGYIYPQQDGFKILANNQTDKRASVLDVGVKIDRFGNENGTFLAPFFSPYYERALPPMNLAGRDPAFPYNYHAYKVIRPLPVEEGTVAPWFGQVGGGVQYKTTLSVYQLKEAGFLEEFKVDIV